MPRALSTGEQIPVVGITQLPNVAYSEDASARANLYAGALQSLAKGLTDVGAVANQALVADTVEQAKLSGYEAGARDGFQPIRKPGLVYEAFNKAAMTTYQAKLAIGLRENVTRIAAESEGDPLKMAAGFKDYRQAIVGTLPPELKMPYTLEFDTTTAPYLRAAQGQAFKRVQDDAKASMKADAIGLGDLARQMGGFIAAGDAQSQAQALTALGSALGGTINRVQEMVRTGMMGIGEAHLALIEANQGVAKSFIEGYVVGAKDKNRAIEEVISGRLTTLLPTIEEKNGEFVPKFTERPILSALPLDEQSKVLSWLKSAQSEMKADAAAALGEIGDKARDWRELAVRGFPVPQNEINTLMRGAQAAAAAGAKGADRVVSILRETEATQSFLDELRPQTPADVQNTVAALHSAMMTHPGAANPTSLALHDAGVKFLGEMTAGLRSDPLEWGNRSGLIHLDPLTLTGPAASVSGAQRVRQAGVVANHYGIEPLLLTGEETTQLARTIEAADPAGKLAIMSGLRAAFGSYSDQAFRAIAPKDPTFAYQAGLAERGPAQSETVRRALVGLDAIKAGNKLLPTPTDLQARIPEVLGAAYAIAPGVGAAVIETARGIYAERALRDPDLAVTIDNAAWRDALQLASGATKDGRGNVVGGVIRWPGRTLGMFGGGDMIVAPAGVSEDEFSTLMGRLTDEDLTTGSVGGAAPKMADGTKFTTETLSRGRLLTIGDGQYLVDMGDEQYVLGSGFGGRYILDIQALLPALRGRGAAK